VSTVTVQLFASYAELLGSATVELPLTPGTTVIDLVHHIRSLPGGSRLPAAPRIALNRTFATSDQIVSANDEIALIPPVAGG
jgi:molybdopterin converting factor small subunit